MANRYFKLQQDSQDDGVECQVFVPAACCTHLRRRQPQRVKDLQHSGETGPAIPVGFRARTPCGHVHWTGQDYTNLSTFAQHWCSGLNSEVTARCEAEAAIEVASQRKSRCH